MQEVRPREGTAMPIKAYGEAISALAVAHEHINVTEKTELVRYLIRMSINALTDCINDELGFIEPDRPICDCDKNPGPKVGEEAQFYRDQPLREAS